MMKYLVLSINNSRPDHYKAWERKNISTQRTYTYTYIIRTVIPLGRKYSEILCTVNGNSKPDHYKAWERKTSQLKEYIHIHI